MTQQARERATEVERWRVIGAQVSALVQGNDPQGAIELCQKAVEDLQEIPFPAFRLAQLCNIHVDLQAADTALELARARGLPDAQYLDLRQKLDVRGPDVGTGEQAVEDVKIAGESFDPTNFNAIAEAYQLAFDWENALEFANKALGHAPGRSDMVKVKFQALVETVPADRLEQTLGDWIFGPGASASVAARVIIYLFWGSPAHRETVLRFARKAVATWPDNGSIVNMLGEVRLSLGDAGDLQWIQTQQGGAVSGPDNRAQQVREYTARYHQNDDTEALVGAVSAQIDDANLRRGLVVDDPDKDVLISPAGPLGKTVLVFTGTRDDAMLPIEVLDAYLAQAGFTAIYLRDFRRVLFGNGIQSLGADYPQTLVALTGLLQTHAAGQEVSILGISGGGLGALQYGTALGISRITCFSPATNASEEFAKTERDNRDRIIVNRLQSTVPDVRHAIRPHLEAMENPPRVEIIFGEGSQFDTAHARDLQGVGDTILYPLPGFADHMSLRILIIEGLLEDVLAGDMHALAAYCQAG